MQTLAGEIGFLLIPLHYFLGGMFNKYPLANSTYFKVLLVVCIVLALAGTAITQYMAKPGCYIFLTIPVYALLAHRLLHILFTHVYGRQPLVKTALLKPAAPDRFFQLAFMGLSLLVPVGLVVVFYVS